MNYISPKECAEILKCSAKTVYKLIREGNLPALRAGRAYRINSVDLGALAVNKGQA